MTKPLLAALMSEPAKSPATAAKPRSQPREATDTSGKPDSRREKDKDFAATMSSGTRNDSRKTAESAEARGRDGRPRAESARTSDAAATEAENAKAKDRARTAAEGSEASDPAASDLAPRRQVTIPDLPTKPGTPAPTDAQAADSMDAAQATDTGQEVDGAEPILAQVEVAPTTGQARTAAGTGSDSLSGQQAVATPKTNGAPGIGTTVAPDVGAASGEMDEVAALGTKAASEEAAIDPRSLAAHGRTDSRAAAAGAAIAQTPRDRGLTPAPVQTPAESRISERARETLSRAVESAAPATPAAPQATAAQTTLTSQMAAFQPVNKDSFVVKDTAEHALSLDGEAENLRFDMRGTAGTGSTQQGSFASAVGRADVPRHVAMQIGEAVRAMPDRPVDIALNPEELGRVRLSISISEGGVTLSVLAERPETLDMMRRHADQLARELADLGFASIDLSFGQGRGSETEGGDDSSGSAKAQGLRAIDETETAVAGDNPTNRLTLSPSGGLDIRI